MMNMPSSVALSIPPMTTVPIVLRETPPDPDASQSGTQPSTNANDVIKMGRSRMRAPISAASINDLPRSYSVLANSTIKMAFLAARPINMIRPICA